MYLYCAAFATLIVPMRADVRMGILLTFCALGMRRPVPVLIAATCLCCGEAIVANRPTTWTYDQPMSTRCPIPVWLLPLWVLATQFCIDCSDFYRYGILR